MSDRTKPDADEVAEDADEQDVDASQHGFEGELPDYMTSTKPNRVRPSALDLERPPE